MNRAMDRRPPMPLAAMLLVLPGCDAAGALVGFGWWVGVAAALILLGVVLLVMAWRRR